MVYTYVLFTFNNLDSTDCYSTTYKCYYSCLCFSNVFLEWDIYILYITKTFYYFFFVLFSFLISVMYIFCLFLYPAGFFFTWYKSLECKINKRICQQSYNHGSRDRNSNHPPYPTVQKQVVCIPRLHTSATPWISCTIRPKTHFGSCGLLHPNICINSVTRGFRCVLLLAVLWSLSVVDGQFWCIIGCVREPQVMRHGSRRWNVTDMHMFMYLFHIYMCFVLYVSMSPLCN